MRKTVSTISVAALVLAGGSVLGVSSAQALPALVSGCVPETWTEVDQIGPPTYVSLGSAVGKFNASTTPSQLVVQLTRTTAKSTTWNVGASASVSWGIAKVEVNTSFGVTDTTTTGSIVSSPMNVPARSYGYAQPKVEFRLFHIHDMRIIANCNTVAGTNYGYLKAITAYPFFSECVGTLACTPRP